jgi:N-acetylneuraminic acid mutarotase
MRRLAIAATALLTLGDDGNPAASTFDFEARVQAQEAIERVYYRHQLGSTRPFESAVPRHTIESKVRKYLKQTRALESMWSTPVTAAMLQNEIDRMAHSSRMPDRLRELYTALQDDPALILETLARPVLVDRLTRNFFMYDGRIHREARHEARTIHRRLTSGDLDWRVGHPRRRVVEVVRTELDPEEIGHVAAREAHEQGSDHIERAWLTAAEFDRRLEQLPLEPGAVSEVVEEAGWFEITMLLERTRDQARYVSYRVDKKLWERWWSGIEGQLAESDGIDFGDVSLVVPMLSPPTSHRKLDVESIDCLPEDEWSNGALGGVPRARWGHTAVWTGSVMIVWGGTALTPSHTGGRYDPTTDTWSPTSTINAPVGRYAHTAIWTGRVMIVWGGLNSQVPPYYLDTGGMYDPVEDAWVPTSTAGAPGGRQDHTAVWTGAEMIVWGGSGFNTGGRYDPGTDTWEPTSTVNAPTGRSYHSAVWTGTRVIVWGGHAPGATSTGGVYDPGTNEWSATGTLDAPAGRGNHTALWTGTRMIVWGGRGEQDEFLSHGGQYDPMTASWSPVSDLGPVPRAFHSAIWTGDQMIVWGGLTTGARLNDGWRYEPSADAWSPLEPANLSGRSGHSAVWTGMQMIIWGGVDPVRSYNNGGRYDPAQDTWTPTALLDLPVKGHYRGVWTGSVLFVWAGPGLGEAGRYDPATATWSPVSRVDAPPYHRSGHTIVWTGERALVWGGRDRTNASSTLSLNSGGRYDPIADDWEPTSTNNTPAPRLDHTAVWTGSRMIVWGGYQPGVTVGYDSGGLYDPVKDLWTPTSVVGAPSARRTHTAIWTGTEMIVWGGSALGTGGRFDPQTDTWIPTSTTDAPTARGAHSAVWTGNRMIIWGGTGGGAMLDTGGSYDPTTDSWRATSTSNAPSARQSHGALWTGDRMVVWGGNPDTVVLGFLASGGRYDPTSDSWTPTSTTDAPSGRSGMVLVWTGSMMIVWGGYDSHLADPVNDGSHYSFGSHLDDDGDGFSDCDGDCDDSNPNSYPAAPEHCNGTDDNCDGSIDEDADGDGRAACEDCAPTDPASFAVPDEVTGVRFDPDTVTIRWDASGPTAGAGTVHDLARGFISDLPVGSAPAEICLGGDLSGAVVSDPSLPAAGTGFWYLVRGRNVCGPGSYGRQSDGGERITAACPF